MGLIAESLSANTRTLTDVSLNVYVSQDFETIQESPQVTEASSSAFIQT